MAPEEAGGVGKRPQAAAALRLGRRLSLRSRGRGRRLGVAPLQDASAFSNPLMSASSLRDS